jgi:hypothetical protein
MEPPVAEKSSRARAEFKFLHLEPGGLYLERMWSPAHGDGCLGVVQLPLLKNPLALRLEAFQGAMSVCCQISSVMVELQVYQSRRRGYLS